MPSSYSNSPFLSLRPDSDCGRTKGVPNGGKSFSSLSGAATPRANGHVNGVNGSGNDEFLKLDAPQQDLLLLHGPRQKYQLEKSKDIPELQGENEILVQVLAIGLNPTDWKGADYGYGQPSYPWVNGRDFAGIVVRASRNQTRVKQGDVVFGASTDYRDIRKAAYQEYVVSTEYNVTRIPQGVSVKEGAALGVAYVAALVSLGISFGLDLTRLRNAPAGPDLIGLTRSLSQHEVPEDIRKEIFSGISDSERPQPGEWLAIWGANSMTGRVALQLAKHAGLKVICIGDVARGGTILSELGADFMVDKYDEARAIDIIKAVTGGKLRFGIDCNGKDTAASLQQALTQSDSGLKSHLLGLSGLPKDVGRGVVHHQVPIKIFHEAPEVGEAMSTWLESLLVHRALKLPEVEIAEGGLSGINDALDRMRTGQISGKRIVVPVGQDSKSGFQSPSNGVLPNGIGAATSGEHADLSYADSLNYDPERVRFAYWVPNVSGGLVISKIKQRTHWDMKSNIRYARIAEQNGFEYALSQIRFMAGYGAENQHEPVSLSLAMMLATERLKVIAALLPGPWNPAVAAKMIASIDQYTEGRCCVNVVSGWFRAEFASIGQWWLDHAERYRRSREFIECLKGIWTNEKFTYNGDFYQFHDYPLKPKPMNLPGRPYPEIFQGGNSDDAKDNAGAASDYYFMNGNTLENFQAQIADVKERAKKNGREGQVGFALNAFVICRDTEEEALRTLQEIQGKADKEAVEGFRQQVQNAGASTGNKSGMWANSKFEDLVQYNDGFKTKLIGTKEQIAERIVMLKSLGVSIILTAFLHYEEEIEHFGKNVIPLVRELEKQGRGKDQAYEIEQTGYIYAAKNSEPKSDESASASDQPSMPSRSHIFQHVEVPVDDDSKEHSLRGSEQPRSKWAPDTWKTAAAGVRSFSKLKTLPSAVSEVQVRQHSGTQNNSSTEVSFLTAEPPAGPQNDTTKRSPATTRTNYSALGNVEHSKRDTIAASSFHHQCAEDTYNASPAPAKDNPSIPSTEEVLARAREMLDTTRQRLLASGEANDDDLEAFMGVRQLVPLKFQDKKMVGGGKGDVGVQWEEPPEWKDSRKSVAQGSKIEEDSGQGNVGTQWDDPPDVDSAIQPSMTSQTWFGQRSRVDRPTEQPANALRGESGHGNVGVQWEEPPVQGLTSLTIDHDATIAALSADEQSPDLSRSFGADEFAIRTNTAANELRPTTAEGENTALSNGLNWDPVSETFTQQGTTDIDPNTALPVSAFAAIPEYPSHPVQETEAEQGDVTMLMGSKEGELPEGMVWDAVNENFTQQPGSDNTAPGNMESTFEEPNTAHVTQERQGSATKTDESSTSWTEVSQSQVISARAAEESNNTVGQQPSEQAVEEKPREESGRESRRSDGASSTRQSLNGSQKELGLFGRMKRKMSRAKWHYESGIH